MHRFVSSHTGLWLMSDLADAGMYMVRSAGEGRAGRRPRRGRRPRQGELESAEVDEVEVPPRQQYRSVHNDKATQQ